MYYLLIVASFVSMIFAGYKAKLAKGQSDLEGAYNEFGDTGGFWYGMKLKSLAIFWAFTSFVSSILFMISLGGLEK